MHLEALRQVESCCGRQVLIKGTGVVRVQVILHEHHLLRLREPLGHSLHEAAIVGFRPLLTRLDNSLAAQWLKGDKQDVCPFPLLFIIEAGWLSGFH